MAHRIKSVETKATLNVSQDHTTSPVREVPDSQGGETQAAAGLLVDATETQVVPESYEYAKNRLGVTEPRPAAFDELYDTTPRKSSQKVPLKPAHLPAAQPQQPGRSSSDRSNSSKCFSTVDSATSQTEAMTSVAKAGKLPAARPFAGGAAAKLWARRGIVVEEQPVQVPVSLQVSQRKAAKQEARQTTTMRPAGDTRKRKSNDSESAAPTMRTNGTARVAERPAPGKKRGRATAAKPTLSKASQPARKPVARAAKVKAAPKSQPRIEDDEATDDSQPPTKRRCVPAAKASQQGKAQLQDDAIVISDREISSLLPEDIAEDAQVAPPKAPVSKPVLPRTPAPARSSPPARRLHHDSDDGELFAQAARSSKKVNLIGFGKQGALNQGVLSSRTSGARSSRAAAAANSTKTVAQVEEDLTLLPTSRRPAKSTYRPKSSNVAENVGEAVSGLWPKAQAADDEEEYPEIDDNSPKTSHRPSQPMLIQRETTPDVGPEQSEIVEITSAQIAHSPLRKSLATPAPRAQPDTDAQPPEVREIAKPRRHISQGVQTVDVVGSPVPQGMGIGDPLRTVLETFSQQETHDPRHGMSSNAKAVPASPRAGAPTTLKASKSQVEQMLAEDKRASEFGNPFHGNKAHALHGNTVAATETRTNNPLLASKVSIELPKSSVAPEPITTASRQARPMAKATHRLSVAPIVDENHDDPEKTLVDHDSAEKTLVNDFVETDLGQWTAGLKPHQLSLFDRMVECAQKLTEYMVDQEKGTERMVAEHCRRTMFLIEQEEKHRAKELSVLQRAVHARKEERIVDAKEYHRELLVHVGAFEREQKLQSKRAAAWDASGDDVEAFINQYL
ncbi:hypothetical protein Slin15195_G110440 [Septoria linicola]|uniref:Uncharacterized protein n=1 Tax=Septoria linicola TaxID=215465 RepID=A0A9Q9AZ10_9PEZI|nr:hypothetical protein Slin15195_G110440 [Septoria linicola]